VTILLWGLPAERPLERVRAELERLGAPTLMLDQHAALETEVDLVVGSEVGGSIRVRDQRIDLRTVTAAYVRPYDSRRLPEVIQTGERRHALAVEETLYSWSEITPALVVNRPGAMAANGSKPYQLEQIRRFGFAVPETLITTDPDAARVFWERHGSVVYKSVSGIRSIVSRLCSEHVERLADISHCPTQFQRYVPGRDHRVHVVGDEVFACEVISEADDYRYPAHHPVEIRSCRLPREVEDRCRLLATAARLPVAGIDLRRTPEGDWYCFEVNPSPAFAYYESRTAQPIGRAIAKLLAAGSQGLSELTKEQPSRDLAVESISLSG
jgi:hypothetical protein